MALEAIKLYRWLRWVSKDRTFPWMDFASERLFFRRLVRADVGDLCRRVTFDCVEEMCPSGHDVRKPRVFYTSFANGFVIERDQEAVGAINFHSVGDSFGLWIAPEHRGQRYGSETVRAFLRNPRLARMMVSAGCYEDNIACRRILEGNDFVEEKRYVIKSPFSNRSRVAIEFHRRA